MRRLVRPLIWTALAVHWLTIFTLTHLPARRLPKVNVNDKIEHVLAYFALAVLLYTALRTLRPIRHLPWIVLITCAIYGALDEYLQYALPISRDGSVWDWTADLAGTLVGMVICVAFIERVLIRVTSTSAEDLPRSP